VARSEAEEKELQEVKKDLAELKRDSAKVKDDLAELLDIFRASKGFIKVLWWLGYALKWLAGIGVAIAAAYAIAKGYIHPRGS